MGRVGHGPNFVLGRVVQLSFYLYAVAIILLSGKS